MNLCLSTFHSTCQQQHNLDNLFVLRDLPMEALQVLYIASILPPDVNPLRRTKNMECCAVDCRLDVLERWIYLDIRYRQFNFDFKKWPLQHYRTTALIRTQPIFECPKALFGSVQNCCIHQALVVGSKFIYISGVGLQIIVFDWEVDHDVGKIIDRALDLQIALVHERAFDFDRLLLQRDELF